MIPHGRIAAIGGSGGAADADGVVVVFDTIAIFVVKANENVVKKPN
jgi:hypothetical protein